MISSAIGKYNNMVTLEEGVDASWSQVENVYQRRADLIPNLVATVKGYAEHEQETFTAVTEARSKVNNINLDGIINNPQAMQNFQQAQTGLSGALSKLMVVQERYPDLKANQNFLDLQTQLEGTENRIAVERNRFNRAAQGYNTIIRRFPGSIYAGMFGFDRKAYFEAESGSEVAPQVEF
ncbi:MAG: LemA family protein [Candidatus Marinimicrobia bacterium]|jgi:LemA protein|nr:LemA family protein [Candidatus Neomarinimicrobiota bacterium]MBT3575709.1 LemA family protein [Candidatus Neomarinimicrobiota bacterium]MBT3679145.1 LemA family protein [Candidatus Neomarinimicrobiota bacterium]MBT3949776.1 LemA family protein [Candidatus Neomarinimicrobiota bacterium]MBT4251997.1 LemA family protein [Candidatus Neomarinimicrobiota bacterium]